MNANRTHYAILGDGRLARHMNHYLGLLGQTRSGWSSAMRWSTRAPRSWPAAANREKPKASITSTWSRAMARLL